MKKYETILFAEREENGVKWRLQIRHCGPRQSGKYAVVAKNRSGVAKRQWILQLDNSTTAKQSITTEKSSHNSHSSSSIEKVCKLTHFDLNIIFTWLLKDFRFIVTAIRLRLTLLIWSSHSVGTFHANLRDYYWFSPWLWSRRTLKSMHIALSRQLITFNVLWKLCDLSQSYWKIDFDRSLLQAGEIYGWAVAR